MEEEIELLKMIDRYVKGKLTTEEVDELWAYFLKNPEVLEWLNIEIYAREYLAKNH